MTPVDPRKEESRAVLAANEDLDGVILWYEGDHIEGEVEAVGTYLEDLGLTPSSAGIWIWEGIYSWCPGSWECPEDGDSWPKGTFRRPTEEEWVAIREGRSPWSVSDM